MKRYWLAFVLMLIYALVLGLPLSSVVVRARAASLVTLPNGQRAISVDSKEEAVQMLNEMLIEVRRLQALVDGKHKVECNLI
ncbi:MAG: hypothetical protein WC809_18795 [Sinimarinibacterium sp.]|jgi:hypothetical protein